MGNNPVSNAVNFVLSPIQTGVVNIVNPIEAFFSFIGDMKNYKTENEQLKIENTELMSRVRSIEEYEKENERLLEILKITEEMADNETVVAKIIAYEPDNWFSYITINKGISSGINISDPVMTAGGLLGQVTDVGANWAKISTIINSESSVGVEIVRNGEIGIVEGDSKLSKTNKCRLGYLLANVSVMPGDILKTSGLGGIYPPGLMVGKISEVTKDNMGRLDHAVVEPFIDFDNLHEVIVITDWSQDEEFSEETTDGEQNSSQDNDENTKSFG